MKMPVVNHCARTITMTERFQHAAAEYGSPEFQYMMKLQKACPNYEIIAAKPRRVAVNKSRPSITYTKMRAYIGNLRDSEVLLEKFDWVREYSKSLPCPYKAVLDWFYKSFPDYGSIPEFDDDGFPKVRALIIPFEGKKENDKATENTFQQDQAIS